MASLIGIKIMENPKVLDRLALFKINQQILPLMIEKLSNRLSTIFEYNAGSLFKYLVLICLEKMLTFSETQDLRKLLNINQLALFMSRLIHHTDIMIIALTTQIIEILITKIPEIYILLGREGVIQHIEHLSQEKEIKKLEAYTINNKKLGITNGSSSLPAENMRNLNYLLQKNQIPSHILQTLNNSEVDSQIFENVLGQLQGINQYNDYGLSNPSTLPIVGGGNSNIYSDITQKTNLGSLFASNDIFNPPMHPTKEPTITKNSSSTNNSTSSTNNISTGTFAPNFKDNKDFSRDEAFLMKDKIKKDLLSFKGEIQSTNNSNTENDSSTLFKMINSTEKNDKFDLSPMEIESESKPNPLPKNPELEKLDDIKKELLLFLQELYVKMQKIVENDKISVNIPQATLFKINDISNSLLKGQSNPNEFGVSIFEKYVSFISEHNAVTKYEIKFSRLLKNLLNFLLDNVLDTKFSKPSKSDKTDKTDKSDKSNPIIIINKKIKSLISPVSSAEKLKEEEKLNTASLEEGSSKTKEKSKLEIDLTENECKTILARLMVFLSSFKKPSFQNPKGNPF